MGCRGASCPLPPIELPVFCTAELVPFVPGTALSRPANIVVIDHFTDAGAQRGWGWETASVRHIDLRHWTYRARVLFILMGAGQYSTHAYSGYRKQRWRQVGACASVGLRAAVAVRRSRHLYVAALPGWKLAPPTYFDQEHARAIAADRWVIEGLGARTTLPGRLQRATHIVLIDMPLWVHFWLAAERQIAWSAGRLVHPPSGSTEPAPLRGLFTTIAEVDRDWMPDMRKLVQAEEIWVSVSSVSGPTTSSLVFLQSSFRLYNASLRRNQLRYGDPRKGLLGRTNFHLTRGTGCMLANTRICGTYAALFRGQLGQIVIAAETAPTMSAASARSAIKHAARSRRMSGITGLRT